MKKYFGLVSAWAVAIALFLCLRGANRWFADPTDDFSLTLTNAPLTVVYGLMSVRRVNEIFQDRLDHFPGSQTAKLSRHFVNLCQQYRFDPAFVLSLIQVESSFHVQARSPDGAVGLMQVMPGTALKVAHDLGIDFGSARLPLRSENDFALSERVLMDPYVNLTLGVAYLASLRDHYQGLSPYYLVAAYNVGPARVDELLSRKSFKPVNTKKYYEAIRAGVPGFRFYRHPAVGAKAVRAPLRPQKTLPF